MEICPKCGLPEQACVCEQIAKDSQRINVKTEKKRYGKISTLVNGFDKRARRRMLFNNLLIHGFSTAGRTSI